jgi:TP901 family phage tail tape measure protein
MRSVEMQFNKMMSRLSGRQANFSVNSKSFTQPLGRITASANEFTKSLEASNARVIAFGLSVGIINAVSNAFKGLVAETIKFQKVMADINVIMGSSQQSIEAFGMALFDTAKNTGQSFNQVAEAALEFSRQGLSMEETLRRTNDALILTRLTSLKAEEAVSGLTAAVNAFGDSGVTTTDIIDKLAAVDVNFAVSSEDLINALERTGAVAIDAGVKLNNLIGIVTSLQQTTARGGSVIGNGLKTIFTRIRRPESIRQLEEMGVQVKNLQGNLLPADKVLQNIAKSFDSLTESQQSNITQFAAGIFQANIFKSALRDLAKEQNIFERATAIAGDAMGDAAIKNEQLNKTLDALAKRTTVSIEELAEVIGNLTLKGPIGGILENVEGAANGLKNALGGGEEAGNTFFTGFVKGIGNVLSGPGLVAFTAVMGKMLMNVGKFASQSLKDVLGVVGRKEKLVQMENSIIGALSQNKQIQEGLNELEGDRLAQEKFMLKVIEAQTNAMIKQKQLASSLAGAALRAGVNPDLTVNTNSFVDLDGSGTGEVGTRASGHIPTSAKRKERKGAIEAGYTPGGISSMSISGVGKVVYNKAETVKKFPGMDQPAIMPPRSSRAGKKYEKEFSNKHGFDPYAFKGYVPNFAAIQNDLTTGSQAMELRGLETGQFKTSEYRKQLKEFIAEYGDQDLQGSGIDITFTTQANKLKGSSFKATGGDKSALSLGEYLEALGIKEIESKIPFGYIDDVPRMAKKPKVYHKKVLSNLNKGNNDHKGNVGESLFLGSGEGDGYRSSAGLEATDEYGSYKIDNSKGKSNFVVDAIKPGEVPFEIKAGEIDLNNIASKSIRRYSNFAFRDQVGAIADSFVGDTTPNPSAKGLTNDDVAKELNYMISKIEEDLLVESLAQLARMGSWNPVGMSMSEVRGLIQKNQLQKTLRENPALIDEAAKDLVVSHGISSGFVPNYASERDVYNMDGKTINARNEYTLASGKIFRPHRGQMVSSGGYVNGDVLDRTTSSVKTESIPVSDLLDPSTVLRTGFPATASKMGKDFQSTFGDRAYMGDPGGPTSRFDWEKNTEGDVNIGPGQYNPDTGINPHVIKSVTHGEAAKSGLSHTATKMLAKANNTPAIKSGLEFMMDRDGGSSILDVALPSHAAEFINSKGLDGYEMVGNKINYGLNSDPDVEDIASQGMNSLGVKMNPDWIRPSIYRDYVNTAQGLVPNFNALNLKTGYFSESQIKAAIKTAYERRTGGKIQMNSPEIEKYMHRYMAAIQDAQADDPEGFTTSYAGGDGKIKNERILFNEISLALEKAGNYYQPKPGETVREDDFSKGLVPNFANLTLYRGQNKSRQGIDEPTIGKNMPSFDGVKTPEDVVGVVQDFVKSHVSGVMAGYRDIGDVGNQKPSGATSFSTSKTVAKNFAGAIRPGKPVEEGHVLEKTVPEKNVFNKKKMLRILNKGADPEKGHYPKVEEFKEAMASGAIQKWAEENGGLYLNVYGRRNDRSLLDHYKMEYGRKEYDFYDKTMKQMVPESDIGYNPNGTRQILPGESEVMQVLNKGLVPNFAMSVRQMEDPATGTSLKYRQYPAGHAEILHATRGDKDLKGGAFNNFNKLLKDNESLGSGFLTPQRNGMGSTPWANIVSMFPQIKYRVQEGLQTGGVFGYSEGYDEQQMGFDSLVNFKSDINKHFTKPENADIASLVFKPFGGPYDMDEAVNFQDLMTTRVKGKGDSAAGFSSKGLVPNFVASNRVEKARKGLKADTKNYLKVTPDEYKQFQDIVEWMQMEFPVSGLRLDKETFSISANTEDIRHIKSVMDNPSVIRNMEKDGIKQPSKLMKSFLKKHTESLLQAKNFQRKGISEGVTSNHLLRGYFKGDEDKYYDVANKGIVPNFSDPLVQAIKREKAAGVPPSTIRIERSNQLVDRKNPLGLAVTNTRDEPLGVNQGIKRAKSMNIDPKKHGAQKGLVPNYALTRRGSKFGEYDSSQSNYSQFAAKPIVPVSGPSAPLGGSNQDKILEPIITSINEGAKDLEKGLQFLKDKLTKTEFEKASKSVEEVSTQISHAEKAAAGGDKDAFVNPALTGATDLARKEMFGAFQKAEARSGGDSEVIKEGDKVARVFNDLAVKTGKAEAAIEAESKGRENGLQRLFFFQSMISMANGFLGEFASTASGASKNLAELGMGASQVFAAYMQQKELIPEISEALGQSSDEQRSVGDIFGGNPQREAAANAGEREAVSRNLRNQQRGGVRGGLAKMTGGKIPLLGKSVGALARGFTRFLPVIGQLYTGFTLVNEAFKFFVGEGIFDLLSSSASKARKQIEELGKTSETVSAALESMKSKEEIQQKMVDLEILGSGRTQKQEQEYYDLRLKSLDADSKLMDSMGALYDENKVGEFGLKAVNKALGGSTEAHAANKKALQDLLVVTKMLTAVESNRVNFSENVDKADSDDNVEKFLRLSEAEGARSAFAMQDLLKGKSGASAVEQDSSLQKNISELRKLAANPSMDIDELNFDANELVGSVGIQGMLDNLKKTTDEFEYDMGGLSDNEIKGFAALINRLADSLSKNDISDGQKAIMMADTKFAKELNKLVNLAKTRVSYEKITLGHQLELNKLRREESAASEDLISEYGMMSNATAAFNKVSRDAASQLDALNKKRADAEDELSIAILDQAKTIMTTNLLSPDLKREGDDLAKSISTFNKRLQNAANADFEFTEFNSRVITDLNVDDEIKNGVSRIFEGAEIDEGTQFQEKLNEITQKIADEQDPRVQLAATLAAVESGILAVEESTLQKLAEASDKYSQLLVSVDLEAKRQDEKNKQSLKKLLIEAKTVEGAKLLEKELNKTLATQETITENLMGQAATLSVQNKFASKRLKLEQDSLAFQGLIFQNLRKQAIESSKSGMEGLSSSRMSNSLLSSAPSKNQEVLDTQQLLMKNQLIKIGEEASSAESAAIEADIRRGMLSDLNMLGKIVADEASAEADNLAIEVQKKALKLSALDNNAKSLETIKSTVQGEMIDLVTTNKTAQIRREIMDKMGYRSIIADQQIEQELSELKDGNKLEKEKLQRLIITGKINEIVSEQVEQEILSTEKSSLINAKKELLLSLNDQMAERMRAAVSLEETGNKLKALRNAKEQALMDQPTMDLMVAADVQTEKFQSLGAVRQSATRATLTDDPDDILAFAEAYKAYNKEIGNNSEIVDALKVKMAEMNAQASNLKSDLVNLGIDSARSGLKGAFKDIATGAKDIGEAFADVGLGIADTIMDRMMDANIDNIIKDLTFAFTGESAKSDAQMVVDANTELGAKLDESSNVEKELSSKLESLISRVESGLTDGVELTNTEKLVANLKSEIAGGASDFAAKFREELKGLFGDKPQWIDNAIEGLKSPMVDLKDSLILLKDAIEKKQLTEAPSSSSKDKVEQVQKTAEKKANEANKPKSQDQINSIALKNKVDPFKQSYDKNPYVNVEMQRRSMMERDLDVSKYDDSKMSEITRNKNIDIAKSKLHNIRSDKDHAQSMIDNSQKTIKSFKGPLYENKGMFMGGNQLVRPTGKNFDEFSSLSKSKDYAQSNFDVQQNKVNDLKLNSDLTNSEDKAEYDSAIAKLEMFRGKLEDAEAALAPLAAELARAQEQLKKYSNKLSQAESKEKVAQKEVNDFVTSDRAVPVGYERPIMAEPATVSVANPQESIATAGTPELSQLVQSADANAQATNAHLGKLVGEVNSAKTEISKIPIALNGIKNSTPSPAEMMAGGKVKKYAKGGLVNGPGGIDNVPAMLTAGEYVIPKDVVSKFNKGGKATWQDRLKSGAQGVMNTAASAYGSHAASRSAQKPQEAGPPVFDEKQLQSLDLGFDVSLNANDKMVSGRLAESNAGLQEYEQHLLNLHEYNVGKKNQKFEKRMGTFNQIMGMVGGYVTSGLVSMGTTLASPLIAKGKEKLGGLFKSKEEKMLDQAKKDVTSKAVSDEVNSFIGDLYGDGKSKNQISQNRRAKKHTVQSGINLTNANILAGHNRYSANKTGIDHANRRKLRGYNKGGSVVPAMLTAGESLIPSSVAKKIGYSNLEQLNTSGDIPIVRGQSGIDKVGPVGLNEGDFVVKKSSTDKLMKRNPNLFKMAVQNPDGFRKGINNYYQGGVVSNNRLPSASAQPQMAPQMPQVQAPQMAPLPESTGQSGQQPSSASSVTNNINVNVSIDESGKETSTETGGAGGSKGGANEKDLSKKIKAAVLDVIRQEKRVGGELS